MNTLITIFIILQTILFFFITFHDWIHIPPLTDIRELEKNHSTKERFISSAIYALIVVIPLLLTWLYRLYVPWYIALNIVIFYGLLTLGTIASWWVPYFFGSSATHKAGFAEYRNTHRFLPSRGDNVIPNTLHIILHLQIWTCFGIALYLLIG